MIGLRALHVTLLLRIIISNYQTNTFQQIQFDTDLNFFGFTNARERTELFLDKIKFPVNILHRRGAVFVATCFHVYIHPDVRRVMCF